MKNILITGGTGFIGYELVRQLVGRGFTPRLLIRRPLRESLFAQGSVEPVFGDLTRPETLARAVQGVDTVFHLGARATFESYATLKPTIVDGSVSLMHAALDAGVETFVYAGSLLVYQSQPEPVTASTMPLPRLGYGRAKLEAEERLFRLAETGSMAFASLRLPHVYGARDLLFNQIKTGRVFVPGNGNNIFAHMHVTDAARILMETAQKGWTGASPVADDMPATWNAFLDEVRKHYPQFRTIHMPAWLPLILTALAVPYFKLRNQASLHTPGAIIGWNLNLAVQPGLIWRDLAISPAYPTIHEGIPAALDEKVAARWCHPVCDRFTCPECYDPPPHQL